MGLVISAFDGVKLVRAMTVKESNGIETPDGQVYLYQDGDRPQSDGMVDGFYTFADKSRRHDVGPYSSYGFFRDALSRLMLAMSAEDVWSSKRTEGPFVELINFSDCDGFIGPKTSAKLAVDFALHADKTTGAEKGFRREYAAFRRAFDRAALGGAVKFH